MGTVQIQTPNDYHILMVSKIHEVGMPGPATMATALGNPSNKNGVGGFLMGVPPSYHPNFDGIVPKNHPFLGTSVLGNPHIMEKTKHL